MPFKIQRASPKMEDFPDKYLPTSQTCFFAISLPKYSAKEIAKKHLDYAVRHCVDMDNDYLPH